MDISIDKISSTYNKERENWIIEIYLRGVYGRDLVIKCDPFLMIQRSHPENFYLFDVLKNGIQVPIIHRSKIHQDPCHVGYGFSSYS